MTDGRSAIAQVDKLTTAHDQALAARKLCQEVLAQGVVEDDLRVQVERARDMLAEAQDSLFFVCENLEYEGGDGNG